MPALRAELMSVPYRPSTAMAKTNWRKRRNVVAMKSGKGREDWIAIFVYFFLCMMCLLLLCMVKPTGWGERRLLLLVKKVDVEVF